MPREKGHIPGHKDKLTYLVTPSHSDINHVFWETISQHRPPQNKGCMIEREMRLGWIIVLFTSFTLRVIGNMYCKNRTLTVTLFDIGGENKVIYVQDFDLFKVNSACG